MEYIKKLKHLVCKELKEYADMDSISVKDLDTIHKLSDVVKNLDKIKILEEGEGYSEYDGGSSYRRGRMYAKRDSMGRYSRDEGYSEYDDSVGDYYSRDDAKDKMMSKLGEMMRSADSEQRRILEKCMKELDNA